MPGEPLHFEDVEVERLRGFDRDGLRLAEVSSGLNVVYGPNASGKTTLAVALERLLWPRELTEGGERLRGTYRVGTEQWRIQIDGRRISHRHPTDAAPPALPPAEHRHRYHLYLPDLIESDDSAFAETIRRRAAGGYDLDEAANALGFGRVHPRSSNLTDRVEDLSGRLDDLREDRRALRERADELESLRNERRRLDSERRQTGVRLEAVEGAIRVVDARQRLERARQQLDSFSDAHAELDGTEAERVRELRERRRDLERDIDALEEEAERIEREIASDPLPEGGLGERLIETLAGEVEELDGLDDRRDDARHAVADARQRRQRLEERLAGVAEAERAEQVEPGDLEAVQEYARDRHAVRADREVIDQLQHVFAETDAPEYTEIETLRAATRALRKWLRARARSTSSGGELPLLDLDLRYLVVGSGLLLVLLGIGLAAALHPAALLVALVGLALVVAWMSLDDESGADADTYRREFVEELEIEPPESWETDAVDRHLRRLEERYTQSKIARAKRQLWDERDKWWSHRETDPSALEQREQRLARRRDELADRLGLNLDEELSAVQAVDHLLQLQRTSEELASKRREVERLDEEAASRLESLTDRLAPFDLAPPESVSEARAVVERLRTARSARRDAESRLSDARRQAERKREERGDVGAEIEELFGRANLATDAFGRLQHLCDEHDDWTEADEQVREAEVAHEQRLDDFDALESADENLLELGADELRERADDLEETRDELTDELKAKRGEITDLEQRVERARSSDDIQRTADEYRRARGQLERERRDDYRQLAGHRLVEFVREQSRRRQLPAVFDRADALFARATNGRYALDFDATSASFLARDTLRERRHPVDELSSGTRIQLSLAVRMAFVDLQEHGASPPLVLDETLANSDDSRAMELIDAIAEFARDGRQIFYLTAQSDERQKWAHYLDDHPDLDGLLHRLEGGPEGAPDDLPRSVPSPEDVGGLRADSPAPEGRGDAEYGEVLDPPAWSPHEPVGRLHLWYLLDEPGTLYELLDTGIRRWGQLEALAERGGTRAVGLDDSTYRRIRSRAGVVATYRRQARRGLDRPIDRTFLEQSDAITDTFIDRVAALCEEVDGDPSDLIAGLREGRVDRFRRAKMDELRRELIDAGHLDPREPLDRETIWSELLAEHADSIDEGLLAVDEMRALLERLGGRLPDPG